MTTVESYRPPSLRFISDAKSNALHPHSPSNPLIRNNKDIPPAAPSPPQFSTRTSPPRKPQIPKQSRFAPKMALEQKSQWLFSQSEILSAPSILDGLPPDEERTRRAKGVNFIMQAGILLKLPQLTLAMASVFFHRFYMRKSMVPEKGGLHQYNIAATALFLATKTEENCRKTKEIVIAVAKVAQKNPLLIIDEQSKEYWRWRDSILLYEELMLEELTFDVVLRSPYQYLLEYLQQLQIEDNKPLRNVAWAFLNDGCMTTLCLLVPSKDIAIAAIYFATKFHGETIPDDESDNPWWEQLGGKPDRIVKAVGVMSEFWSDNPLRKAENPFGECSSSGDDLDKTRRKGSDRSSSVGAVSDALSPNGIAVERASTDIDKSTSAKRKSPDDTDEEGEVEEPTIKRARTAEPETKNGVAEARENPPADTKEKPDTRAEKLDVIAEKPDVKLEKLVVKVDKPDVKIET